MENLIILPQNKISRFVQIIGFIFFSALFYISWHFYLEIILHFDAAFYVFQFMRSGRPVENIGRYGVYIPQLLPLLAYKMGSSLKAILLCYSVSFILLHYIIFLFVTLVLKNNGAGIAIMLVSCLAYYHAFYYLILPLNTCIILAVMLWALIHPETPYFTSKQKNLATAGALAITFIMPYFHPLGIFAIAFVIGVEMIGAYRYKDKQLWIIIFFAAGWFLLRFFVISDQKYDQDQILPFREMFSNLSGWETWPSTHFLSELTKLHFRSFKWLAILLLILSLRKGVLFFLFVFSFVAGYTFIFLANYRNGTSANLYENYYVMYGFFAGLVFAFLFYHPNRKNLVLLLTIPLLWTGVKKIYDAHNRYTDRLGYIERIVKDAHEKGLKKCIVDSKCYPDDYAMESWNVAFETLLYSSMAGPDSAVTVYVKLPEQNKLCDSLMNKRNILFGVQFSPLWFTSNDMPENYFKLPSSGYQYLTHTQDDSTFHEEIFSGMNIKILPLQQDIHIHVNDDFASIPLEIINTTGHTIPAIPRSKNPVMLTYKFLNERNEVLFNGGNYALETDITGRSTSGITLFIPRLKGTYYVKPDIITQGVRSWNIPAQPVKVIID
jgi:hypothetical protein